MPDVYMLIAFQKADLHIKVDYQPSKIVVQFQRRPFIPYNIDH